VSQAFIAGGCAAAVIKLIDNVLIQHITIKSHSHEARMDETEKQVKEINASLQSMKYALRTILHDRIKYLARAYIANGAIDYHDWQDLIHMHEAYHDDLDGNGDLDHLMNAVKKIPMK